MDPWFPSAATLALMSSKTSELLASFPECVSRFDDATIEEKTFGGPSLYFHFACISEFASASVAAKLESTKFFEYLYATLASWGMHRMGKTPTKLRNFLEFKAQILARRGALIRLEPYNIWSLTESDLVAIRSDLDAVLDTMSVGKGNARLVANTKILHHIVPNLVPPVDRANTLAYFGLGTELPSQKQASSIWWHVFPAFISVSTQWREFIQSKVDLSVENWHTSFTKVLDNAIIGARS